MKIIIAYVIVILLTQFAFYISAIVCGIVFGLLGFVLFWLPEKIRSLLLLAYIRGFIIGCAGGLTAVLTAFFVFRWLVGVGSFGFWPFWAVALPLAIPILDQYKFYLRIQQNHSNRPPDKVLDGLWIPRVCASKGILFGSVIGVIAGCLLFVGL